MDQRFAFRKFRQFVLWLSRDGATWFVDGIHGSDTNSCKSPQQACKTIGQAISLASSGDSVVIAAG